MSRAHQLCWWVGFGAYLLSAYVFYRVLDLFPNFHREHSDLIYSVAWLPLGAGVWWLKNRLEDWVSEKDGFK